MISIAESIQLQARSDPHATAIVQGDRELDFRELAAEVARTAAGLAELAHGRPVATTLGNTADHLVLLLAADHAGVPVAPLDRRWDEAKIAQALDMIGAGLVVAAEARDDIAGRPVITPEALARDAAPAPRRLDDTPHLLSLTGGTSGRLKAVRISRRATVARIIAQIVEFGAARDRRFLAMTPLYHGAARSLALAHLWTGASVHLEPGFDAGRMIDLLTSSCTTTFVVPTMIVDLLALGRSAPGARFVSSGAALHDDVAARFAATVSPELYDYFASVEVGGIALRRPGDATAGPGDVGRPMFGTRVEIVPAEGSSEGTGVIAVRSPSICSAVISAQTLEVDPRGLFVTNDRGRIDPSGRVILLGRDDDVIITGGVNVDPVEIENVLAESPGVREVLVVGVPDDRWGQRVVAAYVADGEPDFTAALAHLTPERRPKELIPLRRMPLTALAKPDRHALAEGLAAGRRDF